MRFINQILLISLATYFLGAPTLAAENTPPTQSTEEAWLHTLLSDYGAVAVPLLTGAIGFSITGNSWEGATLGAAIGAIDEILIALETGSPYLLSSGIVGAGVLSKLNSESYIPLVLGAMTGLGIHSGMFNSIKESITAPAQGIIGGHIFGGNPWAIAGGIMGTIDEILEGTEILEGSPLTTNLVALAKLKTLSTVLGIFIKLPLISNERREQLTDLIPNHTTQTIGALIIAYNIGSTYFQEKNLPETDGEKSVTPFQVADSLQEALENIIDPTLLDHIRNQQTIIILAVQIIAHEASKQLTQRNQAFDRALMALDTIDNNTLNNFYTNLSKLSIFLIPYMAQSLTTAILSSHYSIILSENAEDQLKEKYFTGENMLVLALDPNLEVSIDKMSSNIGTLSLGGSELLTNAISTYIGGVYATCILHANNALDLSMLVQIYSELFESIIAEMNKTQMEKFNQIQELYGKQASLQKEISRNAKSIITGNKKAFIQEKERTIINEARAVQHQIKATRVIASTLLNTQSLILSVLEYIFIASKLESGLIPFLQYKVVLQYSSELGTSYAWYPKNREAINAFYKSVNDINKILDKINTKTPDQKENTITYDYFVGPEVSLCVEDFSVGFGEKELLSNQAFCLNQGVYAVSGKSGSGKSTFLLKMQGVENNGWGKGTIKYTIPEGKSLHIHQAVQDDYIIPYSTLLEVITLQNRHELIDRPDLETWARSLLYEIEIDDEGEEGIIACLNEEKDWKNILSGGQKKKVAVISTILAQPHIAILDEIFNGLDSESVANVQAMLKRYLPNTLFLIVDHNYEAHQRSGFFDGRIHLENQAITITHNE